MLIAAFILYLLYTIHIAKKNRLQAEEEIELLTPFQCAVYIVGGIIAIILGGQLVVDSAEKLALAFGMSETLVGLTIVAIGTSLPELVTSVVAAKKGENGMAAGNVVGSNIFNLLLILGVSSTIHPVQIMVASFVDLGMLLGVSLIAYAFIFTGRRVSRVEGGVMVLMYALYTCYVIAR